PLKPDAVLLIEHLRQRNLAGLVAPGELLAELLEPFVVTVAAERVQNLGTPEQFRDNGRAERDLSGWFGQVHLHETRPLRGHRKAVKDRRDGVVPLGRHADAIRGERGEAVS